MNTIQSILVNLLSAAIRNRPFEKKLVVDIDWDTLFSEAKAHDVSTLLYPLLKDLKPPFRPDDVNLAKWQHTSLVAGFTQSFCFEELNKMFQLFEKEDIPVIALKGLVVRSLYPQPELRTMGDADILIHIEYLDRITKLLTDLGYTAIADNEVHIHFNHPHYLPVEVHWSLINERYIKSAEIWESGLWEHTERVKELSGNVLKLSKEDHILYLCLHMAVHILHSGFGLRQLCDFVLLVESEYEFIDWILLLEKAKLCNLERFLLSIFEVCHRFFEMQVPEAFRCKSKEFETYVELLILDILSAGTFGAKSATRMMGNNLIHNTSHTDTKSVNKFKYYLKLAFPANKDLLGRYEYAKKYPVLTPIAWIHRIIRSLFRSDLSLSEKANLPDVYGKRAKLIDWLNLK